MNFDVRYYDLRAPTHINVWELPLGFDPAEPRSIIIACKIHKQWQRIYVNDLVDSAHLQKLVNQFECSGCIAETREVTSRWPNAGEDGGAEL